MSGYVKQLELDLNLPKLKIKQIKINKNKKKRIERIEKNIRIKNIWLHKIKKFCLRKIKVSEDLEGEEALVCLIKIKQEYLTSKENPLKPKRNFRDMIYEHAPEYFKRKKKNKNDEEIFEDPDWGFLVSQSRKISPYLFFNKLRKLENEDLKKMLMDEMLNTS